MVAGVACVSGPNQVIRGVCRLQAESGLRQAGTKGRNRPKAARDSHEKLTLNVNTAATGGCQLQ